MCGTDARTTSPNPDASGWGCRFLVGHRLRQEESSQVWTGLLSVTRAFVRTRQETCFPAFFSFSFFFFNRLFALSSFFGFVWAGSRKYGTERAGAERHSEGPEKLLVLYLEHLASLAAPPFSSPPPSPSPQNPWPISAKHVKQKKCRQNRRASR